MPKTPAERKADANYRNKQKRVLLCFQKDDATLKWLREQVNSDSDLPALIKNLLVELKDKP